MTRRSNTLCDGDMSDSEDESFSGRNVFKSKEGLEILRVYVGGFGRTKRLLRWKTKRLSLTWGAFL